MLGFPHLSSSLRKEPSLNHWHVCLATDAYLDYPAAGLIRAFGVLELNLAPVVHHKHRRFRLGLIVESDVHGAVIIPHNLGNLYLLRSHIYSVSKMNRGVP